MKLDISNKVHKFVDSLAPKQFKLIYFSIIELSKEPRSHDFKKLTGYEDLYRIDIGEYRVIYRFDNETVYILLVDKRNDGEGYKILKHSF